MMASIFARSVRSTAIVVQFPHSQPDHLRWRAAKNGQLCYISIFRHEHESVSLGDEPELWIVRSSQIQEARLSASGKDIRQSCDKLVRDVVIEKQFHACETAVFRSRSAA